MNTNLVTLIMASIACIFIMVLQETIPYKKDKIITVIFMNILFIIMATFWPFVLTYYILKIIVKTATKEEIK